MSPVLLCFIFILFYFIILRYETHLIILKTTLPIKGNNWTVVIRLVVT